MHYRIIKTVITDIDGHRHKTYGISVSRTRINDISFDKHMITELTGLFNRMKLDPIHFQCSVEDYLLRNCNRI